MPETLRGGVIMRLPLTLVKAEVEKLIDLSMMEADIQLITYIE
jgi:hypothetical protein